jgi:hypothetical protein
MIALAAALLLSAAQGVAAPGAAAELDSRTVLWQNVRAGMSRAEVQALYPLSDKVRHRRDRVEVDDFIVTGRCRAEVNIYFQAEAVNRVFLKGKGDPTDGCPDTVLRALVGRYGAALSESNNARSAAGNGFETRMWVNSPVVIELARQVEGQTLRSSQFTFFL